MPQRLRGRGGAIQDLYLVGQKEEAAVAVPEELVRGAALIGAPSEVRERVAAFAECGVTMLTVSPLAATHRRRLEDVERLKTYAADARGVAQATGKQ
ncbi:LLM class flavin-dependent oxidoreductase [Nocardioides sp. cx-169]|uniref:LLM class flavin-dependent oxidoreductase n=1 Tax=Nocardioides sp. cx-169 TaxID=2899080 RepID=UPI0022AC5341|nr:LLM class flavin-dependent oxidoreductase [Nocardioides sp. cx-169]